MLPIFILGLVFLFVLSNIYTEMINESPTWHWQDKMMSDYLYEAKHWQVQCWGFMGLVVAEILLTFTDSITPISKYVLYAAAAGLVGVVGTGILRYKDVSTFTRWSHGIVSAVAFSGALLAEFICLWGTKGVWFPVLSVATLVVAAIVPKQLALEEKTFTAFLIGGLISIVGWPF